MAIGDWGASRSARVWNAEGLNDEGGAELGLRGWRRGGNKRLGERGGRGEGEAKRPALMITIFSNEVTACWEGLRVEVSDLTLEARSMRAGRRGTLKLDILGLCRVGGVRDGRVRREGQVIGGGDLF